MNTESPKEDYTVAPALCLDFDGAVRRTKSGKSFIESPDDIELMPGIEEIIWKYRKAGWLILGVSNQGGVAHGFKTKEDVNKEFDVTFSLFEENPFHLVKAALSDGAGSVYPYNYRSLLRKPDIGMLVSMEEYLLRSGFIVDWDNSLFVGDRPEDEECAKRAGISFCHIDSFLKEQPFI